MPESDVELGRHPAHDSNVVGRPMGMISVFAERVVDAPAPTVYGYLADMREHHPRFLPPAFSAFEVETGGVGVGTITRFTVTAGGRSREYRMKVTEPEPGRVLTETDTTSSLVTTFTVTPQGTTSRCASPPLGRAPQGSGGSSSDCSRRGSCNASTPTNSTV
jgi:hypothetical protein